MALFKCVTKRYCLQYIYLGREKQQTRGECCVLGYECYVGLVLDGQKLWWREHHIAMIRQRGSREKETQEKRQLCKQKREQTACIFPFLRFLRANTHDIQISMRRLSLKRVVCVYERFFRRFQWRP